MPFLTQKTYAQTTAQSVSGSVIDKNNETLVGAIIKVLPNGDMTQTDAKGRFELKNLPANAKLQVSYLGMKTTTVSVDGKKELTILLENSDNNIGEVVVTGYQDVRRPRMTGSVSVIKSSDIAKMDVRSMDQVLRGTMSGVATTYNGRPGSDASIRIRGANSITGSTEPIWIVDACLLTELPPVSAIVTTTTFSYPTGIGDIAPSDIESITVLKDAAATAIYGARAANGVIVVKTKNGREGKATYNASLYYGITERPYSNIRMMNSEEKIRFEREMFLDGEYDSVGRVAYLLNQVKEWERLHKKKPTKKLAYYAHETPIGLKNSIAPTNDSTSEI